MYINLFMPIKSCGKDHFFCLRLAADPKHYYEDDDFQKPRKCCQLGSK